MHCGRARFGARSWSWTTDPMTGARGSRPRRGPAGMELASEMVVKAKRVGLRIDEIPVTYRARPDHSPSKLRAVPDGMRHVRYMLSQASLALFWWAAAGLAAIGFVLLFASGT